MALARCDLPALRTLRLYSTAIGRHAAPLGRAKLARTSSELEIRESQMSAADVVAIAGGRFPELVELALENNWIGDEGPRALAASTGFPLLEQLSLNGNHLTREGVEPFVTTFPLQRILHVSQNPLPSERMEDHKFDEQEDLGRTPVRVPYSSAEVRSWF